MKKKLLFPVVALLMFGFGYTVKAVDPGPSIFVNGRQIYCDVPAQIIDGRTMVPISTIAQALNKDVVWNASENRVDINDKPVTPAVTPTVTTPTTPEVDETAYLEKYKKTYNELWDIMEQASDAFVNHYWSGMVATVEYRIKQVNPQIKELADCPPKYKDAYQKLLDLYACINTLKQLMDNPSPYSNENYLSYESIKTQWQSLTAYIDLIVLEKHDVR